MVFGFGKNGHLSAARTRGRTRGCPWAVLIYIMLWTLTGCGSGGQEGNEQGRRSQTRATNEQAPRHKPQFSGDSAYAYVQKQVAFGPRVPNTEAHRQCGDYLIRSLRRFTDSTNVQAGTVTAYDGTRLAMRNIMGFINPEVRPRIILCAHWDTRPFADFDENKSRQREPILGANDGASGVGVLLELARQMKKNPPPVGVQFIFFDAEDYGRPAFEGNFSGQNNTYCLGSQYWARKLPPGDYIADWGILLDMVGSPEAQFYQEGFSREYAPWLVNRVWKTATHLGYSGYFIFEQTGYVTDDHRYMNQIANIPTIDIIDYTPKRPRGFGAYWHTHDDDMDVVVPETLEAVGRTVEAVVYQTES